MHEAFEVAPDYRSSKNYDQRVIKRNYIEAGATNWQTVDYLQEGYQ